MSPAGAARGRTQPARPPVDTRARTAAAGPGVAAVPPDGVPRRAARPPVHRGRPPVRGARPRAAPPARGCAPLGPGWERHARGVMPLPAGRPGAARRRWHDDPVPSTPTPRRRDVRRALTLALAL